MADSPLEAGLERFVDMRKNDHVGASIALGYVPAGLAGRSEGFQVEVLGEMRDAVMLPEPPFDPAGSRMRG